MQRTRTYPRTARMTAQLQPIVAAFVRAEANTDPLITITNVILSPDHRKLSVFYTTIPADRARDAGIFLTRKAGALREYLAQKARLKIIPHIDILPEPEQYTPE